jgi:SAM-dependent methyltransferase
MDVRSYNRDAWNLAVEQQDRWTIPVDHDAIERARQGDFTILLTPNKATPRRWFPEELEGLDVLCLASGGGQQGPLLAAAGASVTVLDNSPKQLAQDRLVADREKLEMELVEGDMREMPFSPGSFDLIINPVSTCFVPEVRRVWRECARVLRSGGGLLTGVASPIIFCFDPDLEKQGILTVKYAVPYSDLTSLTDEERRRYTDPMQPLSFGHTLEDLIGGQLDAGFVLEAFYDDAASAGDPQANFFPGFHATRARRD